MPQATNETRSKQPLSVIAVRLQTAHDREVSEYRHIKARELLRPPAIKTVQACWEPVSRGRVPVLRAFLAQIQRIRSSPRLS